MQIKRGLLTAGTTFFLAAATGHVMQSGDAAKTRQQGAVMVAGAAAVATVAPVAPAPAADAVVTASLDMPAPSGTLPALPLASAPSLATVASLASRVDQIEQGGGTAEPADHARLDPFGLACKADLSAKAAPLAMIEIELNAPCHPAERVVVSHAGLHLTAKTTADGKLALTLPAFSPLADLRAEFGNGDSASAMVEVPDMASLRRIAVQWGARDGLRLHAFEGAAEYGQPGHVWQGAAGTAATDAGYLLTLGEAGVDRPLVAQVYTYPAGQAAPWIEIEAEVTAANCGRDLEAQRLSSVTADPVGISFAMPECDALGDLVVMRDPGDPMTLAGN